MSTSGSGGGGIFGSIMRVMCIDAVVFYTVFFSRVLCGVVCVQVFLCGVGICESFGDAFTDLVCVVLMERYPGGLCVFFRFRAVTSLRGQ